MATLKIEIITPSAKILEDEAEFVQLPGAEGDMGVYPMHETTVLELKAGEVQVTRKGKVDVMAIGEGFAEIRPDSIAILTDGAVYEKDIDEAKAEAAVKRGEELLKSNTLQGEELEATQAALARSLAQIKVKRRHHP
ncbi:MAG TPA: ATP synthase F1 subunit epsilon [Candidatus Methylacidiphilales bacterium]|nr:ATP synthase F1 subunit epsilon [Candidatus Methylacidiphilales bacterium]